LFTQRHSAKDSEDKNNNNAADCHPGTDQIEEEGNNETRVQQQRGIPFHLLSLEYKQKEISTMAGNASNQRIIPLEEGWNDEIKAKVRSTQDP
jgi:hypothetical protein